MHAAYCLWHLRGASPALARAFALQATLHAAYRPLPAGRLLHPHSAVPPPRDPRQKVARQPRKANGRSRFLNASFRPAWCSRASRPAQRSQCLLPASLATVQQPLKSSVPPPRSRSPHCRMAQPAAGRVQHASPSEAGNAMHDGERPSSLRPRRDARPGSEAGNAPPCLPRPATNHGGKVPSQPLSIFLVPQQASPTRYWVLVGIPNDLPYYLTRNS